MKFNFEGFDAHGAVIKDSIEASDEGKAAELLRDKGVFAQKIEAASEKPMKSVLAGGKPLPKIGDRSSGIPIEVMPWESPPPLKIDDRPPLEPPKRTLDEIVNSIAPPAKPVKPPKVDWKADLKRDLATVNEIMVYCDTNPKLFAGLSKTAVKEGKELAVKELTAKAIANAVRKAL